MLKPPTSSDLLGCSCPYSKLLLLWTNRETCIALDPSKLTAKRTFNRGTTDTRNLADNLWTETPQERQQRIADEVMGKKRRAVDIAADPDADREATKRRKLDEELRKNIAGHSVCSLPVSVHVSECLPSLSESQRVTSGQTRSPEPWSEAREG